MTKSGSFLIYGSDKGAREETLLHISRNLVGDSKKASADLINIEPDGSIGIDKIRDLERRLKFKPQEKSLKLVIIHQAHLATIEAQNALLKTAEEPPPDSIILIETSSLKDLLPTLVSRCQRIFVGDATSSSLTKEEQEIQLRQNKIVFMGSLAQKFILAQELSSEASLWLERESIFCRDLRLLQFGIKKLTTFRSIREDLEKISRALKLEEIITFEKLISKIRRAILQNVNSRLSLEILFLEAPVFT